MTVYSEDGNMTSPYPLLDGRVAFVTGGAGRIGRAIAERFVVHGAKVAVADIDLKAASEVAEGLNNGYPGSASAVWVDIADEDALSKAVLAVAENWKRLDIAVVNAGVLALDEAVNMTLSEWQRVIDINLTGAFLTARTCARFLVEQDRGGRVIFTGSLMARRGAAQNSAYAAAKFGLMGLMETMAIELAPNNINVNAVNPGQVQSEMIDGLLRKRGGLEGVTVEEMRARMVAHIPKGRLADPSEVADAFVFLGSSLSDYITGQALAVEGGWYLV